MPLRILCPSCKSVNTVDEGKRGQKVHCQDCGKAMSVPVKTATPPQSEPARKAVPTTPSKGRVGDDPGGKDRPIDKKSMPVPAKAGSGKMMLVVSLMAASVLALAGAGVGAYFLWFRDNTPAPIAGGNKKENDKSDNTNKEDGKKPEEVSA